MRNCGLSYKGNNRKFENLIPNIDLVYLFLFNSHLFPVTLLINERLQIGVQAAVQKEETLVKMD